MNNYQFSPSRAAFFLVCMRDDYIKAGSLPEDLVDVEDAVFAQFTGSPPPGKLRGANVEGYPAWIAVPSLTPEEARQDAVFRKKALMDEAACAMAPLHDAVDLDMATEAEKAALLAWKKYRIKLNRLDISTAPDIDWPKEIDL